MALNDVICFDDRKGVISLLDECDGEVNDNPIINRIVNIEPKIMMEFGFIFIN